MSGRDASPSVPDVFTIGHGTRPIDGLLAVLAAHGIGCVADVRAYPASRRYPWFARASLEASLAAAAVRYAWLGDALGGRRRAGPEPSRHTSIRVESFRAYAEHMETPRFAEGVDRLLAIAREVPTATMCAEMPWWRCHRSFLADHLVLTGRARVLHLLGAEPPSVHVPRPEARLVDGVVVYDRPSPPRRRTKGGAGSGEDGLFADEGEEPRGGAP